MSRLASCLLLLNVALIAAAGCDMMGDDEPPPRPKTNVGPRIETSIRGDKATRDARIVTNDGPRRDVVTGAGNGRTSQTPSPVPKNDPPDVGTSANDNSSDTVSSIFTGDAQRGFAAITGEIADLLKLKKTLVVWLIDKTPGSVGIRGTAMQAIAEVGRNAVKKASAGGKTASPLAIAIVGFGKEVTALTPEPIEDVSQAGNLVSGIGEEATDNPLTFTAVSHAAEKFLPYRGKVYEVVFVIAADYNGRDYDKLDDVIPKLTRMAVPVFGVGNAVPFGRETGEPSDKVPSESLALERIDLQYPDRYMEKELTDSGYGPWGLERLCRKTHGRFYRIRRGEMSPGWTTGPDGTIDSKVLAELAPDYVSAKEYQQLLSENKARSALVAAAKIGHADQTFVARITTFVPRENAAANANMLANSQREAADRSLDVDKIFAALSPGESERAKLKSPRWQVEFDLAMGRVLAAKTRIDAYNSLLANLKQGKAFKKPDSKAWVLKRSENVSDNSVLNNYAKNARMYLSRVMKEHPGTPWAVMAEHELTEQPGWELMEQ